MKGHTNNPFGRPKGIPNKTTTEIRESFQQLLENNLENLQSDLEGLEPKERIDILLKLSEFVLPKLQRQEVINENPMQITTIRIVDMDGNDF